MNTVSSPVQSFNPREPIPGYVLRDRIGEGGFGEVWKCDAPGGLTKAVKIVYGTTNSGKAERELKALNRVKQVQHPLLLSIERIEIVDGHLIIVTELADGSLSDRFRERLAAGHAGIDRDELLGYMSDAADALDYLYTKYSLQHLDVKPENLLLLANHVKVADFGMVKNLQEQHETLVGGVTPLYAPPEIYDGKPNKHSDQYSLAVMYQHLLTGVPPFTGRTIAQLAAQHLRADPDLSPLSAADQAAVGRALSKEPSQRFESCRLFVAALRESRSTDRAPRDRRRQPIPPDDRTGSRHEGQNGGSSPAARNAPRPTKVVTLKPTIDLAPPPDTIPTLFVGIGRIAADVLRHLRRRIESECGPLQAIPSLQFLLLDTDLKSLAAATQGDREVMFRTDETLGVPLREARHYRGKSDRLLEWLERRWLFNIPRTLRTEGLRPLGRLAFVDHFADISAAVGRAVGRALDSGPRELSERTLERPIAQGQIRVFVIGSTTGGTGSGMLLDLAYAVRSTLRSLELEDDRVHGIMLHVVGTDGGSRDLQLANSLAFLREFEYFSTAGNGYPGEPACGVPPFESPRSAPFSQSYLVDLGENPSSAELDVQAARLADYLFFASVSTAAGVLDRARGPRSYPEFDTGECCIRSCSLARIGGNDAFRDHGDIGCLCRLLIQRWIGDGPGEQLSAAEIKALADRFMKGLDLHPETLCSLAEQVSTSGVLVEDLAAYAQRIVDAAGKIASSASAEIPQQATVEAINDLLEGLAGPDGSFDNGKTWRELLSEHFSRDAEPRVRAFIDWFSMLAVQPKVRLRGVQHAVSCVLEGLTSLERDILDHSRNRLGVRTVPRGELECEPLLQYAIVRLQQQADRSVVGMVGMIRRQVQEYGTRLLQLRRRLDALAEEFPARDCSDQQAQLEISTADRPRLLREFEGKLDEMSAGGGILSVMLQAAPRDWSELTEKFRKTASEIVGTARADQRTSRFLEAVRSGSGDADIDRLLSQARPRLRQCGGTEYAMLFVPESDHSDEALRLLGSCSELANAAIVRCNCDQTSLCYDMTDIPVAQVVAQFSAGRTKCLDLADRLQSRIDVDFRGV